MDAEAKQSYTIAEAHLYFAKNLNTRVWQLLEKEKRTRDDNELMVHAAHASLYHWLQVGTRVNHQRGEWLIARVFTVVAVVESALRHAHRCMELTEEFADEMQDFDRAWAYEGLARASALAGNHDEAMKYHGLAEKAGQEIADAEDKHIFVADFRGGDWYGLV